MANHTGDLWWCPTCRQYLDPHQVTYNECCVICGGYLDGVYGNLLEALNVALAFVEKERECRESSYLPGPSADEEPYLIEATNAENVIRAAIAKATGGAA